MSQDIQNIPSTEGNTSPLKVMGIGIGLIITCGVVLFLVACIIIAVLLVLGPVVGNVFSNIVENLETPVP